MDSRFVFDTAAKRHFLKWMRKLETFCGLEIVTYCLMSNHFHLLIRVPDKAAAPMLTAESLRKVLPETYSKDVLLSAEQELNDDAVAAAFGDIPVRAPSVPGMIALKLHAMRNDPDRRQRDTQDIAALLRLHPESIDLAGLRALCERYGPPDIIDAILPSAP